MAKLLELVEILAEGEVKESLEDYLNFPEMKTPEIENAPELSEVVGEIKEKLPLIPTRYHIEVQHIRNLLVDLEKGHYYERLHRRGVPRIATIGIRLEDRCVDMLWKMVNDLPGDEEILREQLEEMAKDMFPETASGE